MKICGIVAEYNPFHNGHKYHLEKTREAGARCVVAVMSGSFVQRAEPAVFSKFFRAKIAVQQGADLVIELPAQYAAASSERFARGAVEILAALGVVDSISFGSECGDVTALKHAAKAVEDERIKQRTKQMYEEGESYPKARCKAVEEIYGAQTAELLATPNNLLAVDYLKALDAKGSPIEPFTIERRAVAHDGGAKDEFASASYLRGRIAEGGNIEGYMPEDAALQTARMIEEGNASGGMKAIERVVLYKLRSMSRESFAALPDGADGLGNRLYAAVAEAKSIEELYEKAKTKRYTMSRVRRAVVCALLDIDSSFYFAAPYARVLAIGKNGKSLLSEISNKAAIPVSHSIKKLLELGGNAEKTALAEIRACDIFNLTLRNIVPTGQDFTEKLYTGF